MSENLKEDRDDKQDDIIEQVITQGLEKMKAPTQATAAEEARADETGPIPGPAESDGNAPPPERKNKRSAVCFYLMILFGAAFLITLLACFVQQRSSESAINDLRESMNLSREELLAEIRRLEDRRDTLLEENKRLKNTYSTLHTEIAQWREQYEEKEQEANDLQSQIDDAWDELYSWRSFWTPEKFYQAGDYQSCAAVIISQRQGPPVYQAPIVVQERYAEILQALIGAGILDQDMPV